MKALVRRRTEAKARDEKSLKMLKAPMVRCLLPQPRGVECPRVKVAQVMLLVGLGINVGSTGMSAFRLPRAQRLVHLTLSPHCDSDSGSSGQVSSATSVCRCFATDLDALPAAEDSQAFRFCPMRLF